MFSKFPCVSSRKASKAVIHSYNLKFSQNFLRSSELAKKLIQLAQIDSKDLVIEIGAGKGALTVPVAKQSKQVIAIEKDAVLARSLQQSLLHQKNVLVINGDFLAYRLPSDQKYKVIGNIPFALTADILRKLLNTSNPPIVSYLFLQKEAAYRLMGIERETIFSLQFKPWFKVNLLYEFSRNDFSPVPNVDVVFAKISKCELPLVDCQNQNNYLDFVAYCLGSGKQNALGSLTKLFTPNQLRKIKSNYQLRSSLVISQLKFANWIELFNDFLMYATPNKRTLIEGWYRRILLQQEGIQKLHRTRKNS